MCMGIVLHANCISDVLLSGQTPLPSSSASVAKRSLIMSQTAGIMYSPFIT